MAPPTRRPVANVGSGNNQNSNQNHTGGELRDRHKLLMRQQFYTNNERSSLQRQHGNREESTAAKVRRASGLANSIKAGQIESQLLSDGHLYDRNHHLAASPPRTPSSSSSSSSSTTDFLIQRGEASESTTLLFNDYTTVANATTTIHNNSSAFMLARDCLLQYDQAHHGTTETGLPMTGSGSVMPAASSTTSLVVCNDSQLSLMNIRPEEFNFSDIQPVWLVKSWHEILFRVAFVAPIVLLGILGNATIIYSMCRFKPIRSKPTNIFILNMALADLLTTIVCPNAALLTDIYQFYVLGSFVCRTEGFIKITCLLVSAYSLIVLSFDWFLSVVQPCRTRITIKQSWLTLVSIWSISIVMAAPLLFSRRLRERQWRDLTEVWCCELIQYTKYYWVCMTFFLIYLPTFVMSIVLIVILARMDRFEAKLRRSPCAGGPNAAVSATTMRSPSSMGIMRSSSFSIALDSLNQQQANSVTQLGTGNTGQQASRTNNAASRLEAPNSASSTSASQSHNRSLSISMKYRRRIVKILFFYLLTSIVCWTPLQFTIIYRHFRSEAVPAGWFFELSFFSQLCASLSAAMNPIIFGFLSQPFRRIVVRSCLFRLVYKVWTARQRQAPPKAGAGFNNGAVGRNNIGLNGGQALANLQADSPVGAAGGGGGQQTRTSQSNRKNNKCATSGSRAVTNTLNEQEHSPKLTIEYIDRKHLHRSTLTRSITRQTDHAGRLGQHEANKQRPKSVSIAGHQNHHQHHHHHHHHQHQKRGSSVDRHRESNTRKSHFSTVNGQSQPNHGGRDEAATSNPSTRRDEHGQDNKAYTRADDDTDEEARAKDTVEQNATGNATGNATTSFMAPDGG